MDTFFLYLLKSTFSIGAFYLLFKILLHRETAFKINRTVILTFVAISFIIPIVQLPTILSTPVNVEITPDFSKSNLQIQNLPVVQEEETLTVKQSVQESVRTSNGVTISLKTVLIITYLTGVLITLIVLILNLVSVFLIFRDAKFIQMNGYRLFITNTEIPSFAFGRSVVISQNDYKLHGDAILAHEKAHIKLNHFYDLVLFEIIKIFHWFNPAIYGLITVMKEIHEFQANNFTLNSGIDSTQYQLLIIKKGVGPKRFALANSFNHCQIKKRITMMNKSKTSNAWRWKVATFLPMLVVLLLACGNTGGTLKTDGTPGTNMLKPTSTEIEGAWKYVLSEKFVNGNKFVLIAPGTAYEEMKIWTKGYFAFVGNQGMGGYPFGGSGTYKLNGNLYEESVIYAPGYNPGSPKVKLRLEIVNDTLTQIWPVDDAGKYDNLNYNIIKMVRMKE